MEKWREVGGETDTREIEAATQARSGQTSHLCRRSHNTIGPYVVSVPLAYGGFS